MNEIFGFKSVWAFFEQILMTRKEFFYDFQAKIHFIYIEQCDEHLKLGKLS